MPHPEHDEGRTSHDHERRGYDSSAWVMLGCATIFFFLFCLTCARGINFFEILVYLIYLG
jgi:hypothetical protein